MAGPKLAETFDVGRPAGTVQTFRLAALGVQSPVHPIRLEPAAGVAVKAMAAVVGKLAAQLLVHFVMPAGLEETVPVPVTFTVTREARMVFRKVAVTLRAADMLTTQVALVPADAQSPVQRSNTQP